MLATPAIGLRVDTEVIGAYTVSNRDSWEGRNPEWRGRSLSYQRVGQTQRGRVWVVLRQSSKMHIHGLRESSVSQTRGWEPGERAHLPRTAGHTLRREHSCRQEDTPQGRQCAERLGSTESRPREKSGIQLWGSSHQGDGNRLLG